MRHFRRPLALGVVTAAAFALVPAAPSLAYIVYAHHGPAGSPGGIWVMNDDGSGKHELISERATKVGENLAEPSVDPRGGIVLFTGHGAIWKWQAGKVTNLTSELSTVVGQSNSGFAFAGNGYATALGDGTFVWQRTIGIAGAISQMHTTIKHASLDGKRMLADVPRACGDVWRDATPAPRPGGGIAYTGCSTTSGYFPNSHTNDEITFYSGGSQMVVASVADMSWKFPSWDPSGRMLVAVMAAPVTMAGNFSEGIWVIDVTATGDRYRQALLAQNGLISSPRFAGAGRIVFGFSAKGSSRSDIYSVPSSCDRCSITTATRLTSDGVSTEPAWTGSSLMPGPRDGASAQRGQRLGSALSKGLKLTVVCNQGCLAGASATIDGRLARSLGLAPNRGKLQPFQVGSGSLRSGSGSRTLTVRFSSRAQRALRRRGSVKLSLQVRAINTSTSRLATYTFTVTLKR